MNSRLAAVLGAGAAVAIAVPALTSAQAKFVGAGAGRAGYAVGGASPAEPPAADEQVAGVGSVGVT